MATLTQEQRELLKQGGQEPLRLIDPESREEYVLLRAGAYARMQALLGDSDPREMYPALHRALRDEGWDDPQMDEYNRYG
jgi:CO/xanthine dehydrogenase FAD-binding subunit